jgi:ribonuclease HI
MEQLSFLQSSSPPKKVKKPKQIEMFVDGASRGNPGKAGAGIYVTCDGEMILELGFFLGEKTNNQAEYLALLIGLFFTKKYVGENDFLHIKSDSQLLVRQMKGIYKVKDMHLRGMRDLGLTFLEPVNNYTIEHVLRGKNTNADRMANYGVDKKVEIPKACVNILKRYEVL